MKAGTRKEDLQIYQTAVSNAQNSLASVKQNLFDISKTANEDIKSGEQAISAAQSNLDSAKKDIINKQTALTNAQNTAVSTLNNLYETIKTTMGSNLVTMAVAITDMDNILGRDNNAVNDDFEKYLGVLNYSTLGAANTAYNKAKEDKKKAEEKINLLTYIQAEIDTAVLLTETALNSASVALAKTSVLLDSTTTGTDFTQTFLNNKKTIINTDRTNVNTALTSLQTDKQNIASQKLTNQTNINTAQINFDAATAANITADNNLKTAQQNLAAIKAKAQTNINSAKNQALSAQGELKKAQDELSSKAASPLASDISYHQAQVVQAQSSMDLIKEQIKEAIIKSPFDGMATRVDSEIGEIVQVSLPLISLLADNAFQIESDIYEEDIVKIKINQPVDIYLYAYSQMKFSGKIINIEAGEKLKEGVVYYQVKVSLDLTDKVIKSGMSADINIETAYRENILIVSKKAVKNNIVKILEGKKIKEKQIVLGVETDNEAEIISGLKEGEKVILN